MQRDLAVASCLQAGLAVVHVRHRGRPSDWHDDAAQEEALARLEHQQGRPPGRVPRAPLYEGERVTCEGCRRQVDPRQAAQVQGHILCRNISVGGRAAVPACREKIAHLLRQSRTIPDLTGRVLGLLTVLGKVRKGWWRARCQCGKGRIFAGHDLRDPKGPRSCGCKRQRWGDLTGQRFGRLVVDSLHPRNHGGRYWLCRCDCGDTAIVRGKDLSKPRHPTRSCGCIRQEHGRQQGATLSARRWLKKYPEEMRREAVALLDHMTAKAAAEQVGIAPSTLSQWRNQISLFGAVAAAGRAGR